MGTAPPTTKVTGSIIAITQSNGTTSMYNRDRLSTAYLLLLDEWSDSRGRLVVGKLENEYGFSHADAMKYTIVASLLLRHNIEP